MPYCNSIRTSSLSKMWILGAILLGTAGCQDPIPRDVYDKFAKTSSTIKQRLEDILPKRGLLVVSYRTSCEMQASEDYPFVGKIFVNYRGDNSPIDKSNQLRLRYRYRNKDQVWIYQSLQVEREIVGEGLEDQDAMFEAILKIQPSKSKDQAPLP